MSGEESIDDLFLEDIGKGYRFRPFMQAVIMGIIFFVTALILYIAGFLDFSNQGSLTVTTLVICWVLAFLLPLVVKTKSNRVRQISIGLYLAAILSLTGAIILLAVDQPSGLESTSIPLLIAFLLGIGSQLFQHLNPEAVQRTALVYGTIFGVTMGFFVCLWIYFEALLPGWGIWLSVVVSAIFAYALLPEKPK